MALPLILSLLGSTAAGASMLGSLSPLIAGAIGSGLGTAIQEKDLGKGLTAGLTSGLLGGVAGKLLGGAAGSAAGAGAGAAGADVATQAGLKAAADAGIGAATQGAAQGAGQGGLGGLFGNMNIQSGFQPGPAMPAGTPLSDKLMQGVGGYGAMSGAGMGTALGAGMMMQPPGMERESYGGVEQADPANRERYAVPEGYRPGYDAETLYFDPMTPPALRFKDGGMMDSVRDAMAAPDNPSPRDADGRFSGVTGGGEAGDDNFARVMDTAMEAAGAPGGLSGAFTEGVAAAGDPTAAMAALAAPRARPASGGVPLSQMLIEQGSRNYTPTGTNFTYRMAAGGLADMHPKMRGGQGGQGGSDKDLVQNAIRAVRGDLSERDAALVLGQFMQMFGEDALRRLVEDVRSGRADGARGDVEGRVRGPGDGMDDLVPAEMDDGSQDVLLSDGEFVVPADVVSGLGNGSTDAGAQELEEMMTRVRKERTGSAEQPRAMAVGGVLPA